MFAYLLYWCYSFRFHFIWFHIYFLHVLFLFLFLFLFMFMPSIHVVGWCPVFAKLSMQILDNNNYNRNENTKHMLRGYVWASGLIRTQNILLMWHRNWPVIIRWKCNQCMCVRARVCLIHMLYAPHRIRLFHIMRLKPINLYALYTYEVVRRKMHTVTVTRTTKTQKKRKFIMIYVRFIVLLGRRYYFFVVLRSNFLFNFIAKYQMLSLCPIAVKMRLSQSIWNVLFYLWFEAFMLEFGNCTFSDKINVLRKKNVQIVIWKIFGWTSVLNRTHIYIGCLCILVIDNTAIIK